MTQGNAQGYKHKLDHSLSLRYDNGLLNTGLHLAIIWNDLGHLPNTPIKTLEKLWVGWGGCP